MAKHRSVVSKNSFQQKYFRITVVYSFILLIQFPLSNCGQVKLDDNGYTGVVVALENDINQAHEHDIIEAIKKMFTEASAVIYEATWKRVYFKNVTILVPSRWKRKDYMEISGNENFRTADVRIMRHPNTARSNQSFTMQQSECGRQGQYVHINENHLLTMDSFETTELYGPPGKWLARFWSQYRYGIFEEHAIIGDAEFLPLYFDPLKGYLFTTSCMTQSSRPHGPMLNSETNDACTETEPGDPLMPSRFCYTKFVKNINSETSLTFLHDQPNVKHFCRDEDHNKFAVTKQNKYCNGRSTWSVIMQHDDFKDNKNTPRENIDTQPTFRVVIPPLEKRYVLVFDMSESMNGRRMEVFRKAATDFIENTLPDGSSIALVGFSAQANVIKAMTKLDTKKLRNSVIDQLPTTGNGISCIGCGLLKAIEILKNPSNDTSGAAILLITDGNENHEPRIESVIDIVKKACVQVFTVVYGNFIDDKLELLANQTNGELCFVEPTNSSSVDLAMCMTTAMCINAFSPVKIFAGKFKPEPSVRLFNPISISSEKLQARTSIAKVNGIFVADVPSADLKFITMYDIPDSLIDVAIKSPNSRYINYLIGDQLYNASIKNNVFSIAVHQAPAGEWRYQIILKNVSQNVDVSITSTNQLINPIKIEGWINVNHKVIEVTKERVIIFAHVNRNGKPIANVEVRAEITMPNGNLHILQLFDDGQEPDTNKLDGIYSRYFINFIGNGRYGVKLQVNGFEKVNKPEGLQKIQNLLHSSYNETLGRQISFQRFMPIGSFKVKNLVYRTDIFPPNSINDLRLINFDNDTLYVTVYWTAPGDDFDNGKASNYQMKFSENCSDLVYHFDERTDQIQPEDIIHGSLVPRRGKEREQMVFRVPKKYADLRNSLCIAIRAVDESGNSAKPSNTLRLNLKLITR